MALISVKNALKYNSRIEGINNIKKRIKVPEMQLIL
jgi:hypothetical protein